MGLSQLPLKPLMNKQDRFQEFNIETACLNNSGGL